MRVAPGMQVEWVDQEAVVLNPDDNMISYLNPPAALFYALILEHGIDEAVKELKRSHGLRRKHKKEVETLLEDLVIAGLLINEKAEHDEA